MRAAKAGTLYWAIIFSLGFVLGTVRVLVIIPALGSAIIAVLIELPIILTASWFAARWLTGRHVLNRARELILMGALAFALTILSELTLAVAFFGQTPAAWAAAQFAMPGIIGLAGQMLFGAMPLLVGNIRPHD